MRFQNRAKILLTDRLKTIKVLIVFCSCPENLHEAKLRSNGIVLRSHSNDSMAWFLLFTNR